MLYTHPNKLRSLENLITTKIHNFNIIIVFGPPSCGKKHAILSTLENRSRTHRFSTFEDSVTSSRQAFREFLEESDSLTKFIDGCPFFGLGDNFKQVLDEIAKNRGNKLIIIKLTVDAETTDVIWKYQKHPLFRFLHQIQFNKVAKTYISRWIKSQFKTLNQSKTKNNELMELADGQFHRASMIFSSETHATQILNSNLTHFHALGKVLYNKTEKNNESQPENTPSFISDNQPSSSSHFQNQIINYLPEFNENLTDFKTFSKMSAIISNTDKKLGTVENYVSLNKARLNSVISSVQAFSQKNVPGKYGQFSKRTADEDSENNTDVKTPDKLKSLEDKINKDKTKIIVNDRNKMNLKYGFTEEECNALIESTSSEEEFDEEDLAALEVSFNDYVPETQNTSNNPETQNSTDMNDTLDLDISIGGF